MIHELLSHGAANAIPGNQLAATLNMELRELTQIIERERQAGFPICASVVRGGAGYFMPATAEELALYCCSLDRRLRNIRRTRDAMGHALSEMVGQEYVGGW